MSMELAQGAPLITHVLTTKKGEVDLWPLATGNLGIAQIHQISIFAVARWAHIVVGISTEESRHIDTCHGA
jgi:hypothetical protein